MKDPASLFDGFIVVIGVIGLVAQSDSPLTILRLLRIFRLGRTVKALQQNKDVQALLDATIGVPS